MSHFGNHASTMVPMDVDESMESIPNATASEQLAAQSREALSLETGHSTSVATNTAKRKQAKPKPKANATDSETPPAAATFVNRAVSVNTEPRFAAATNTNGSAITHSVISTTNTASLSASLFFSSQNNGAKSNSFRFGGTQTFSLRQLWPIKAYIFSKQCLARDKEPKFGGETAIISLGVGANMVESIHYWAQCLNILNDKAQPTPFAEYLFGNIDADDYLGVDVDEVAAFDASTDSQSVKEQGLGILPPEANAPAIATTTTGTAAIDTTESMASTRSHANLASHANNDDDNFTTSITGNSKVTSENYRGGGVDPFLESINSLWLLHYCLSKAPNKYTVLWFLFNRFNRPTFTKDDFLEDFDNFLESEIEKGHLKRKPSNKTIRTDLDIAIKTYAPLTADSTAVNKTIRKLDNAEELSDSPMRELFLLYSSAKSIEFNRGAHPSLSPYVVALCLLDYLESAQAHIVTMDFNKIAYEDGSVGRIFKLDENSLAGYLEQLGGLTAGKLTFSEQNGIRQLQCHCTTLQERNALFMDLLKKVYDHE